MNLLFLIIIIVSLVGIYFLLWGKITELRNGNVGLLGKISSVTDQKIYVCIRYSMIFASRFNVGALRKYLYHLSNGLFHIFGTLGLFVSKYYSNFVNSMNGKRPLKGRGVVSFFLKDVSESRADRKER